MNDANDVRSDLPSSCVVVARPGHPICRRDIDPDALRILDRLQKNGFVSYLCGGAVRDLLLGRKPKDFDIVTDARPGQIKKRFPNVYVIGRRFRLAHVHFPDGKIIEVATFRRDLAPDESCPTPGENAPSILYGTPREDAFRRDLTINALYYDDRAGAIIDYVGGLEDIERRRVRMIGDPTARFREDAVRIWRIVRYAARLDFSIDEAIVEILPECAPLLGGCSGARLYEEMNKEFAGRTQPVMDALRAMRLLRHILGSFGETLESDDALYERVAALLRVKDGVAAGGTELLREEMYALFFQPWAEGFLAGARGDPHFILDKAFENARMQAVVPRKMKADIGQILVVLDRMQTALHTGRMRWSLKKRAFWEQAERVLFLVREGRTPGPEESFETLFRRAFPSSAGVEPPPKKRRRRKRPRRDDSRDPGSNPPPAGTSG